MSSFNLKDSLSENNELEQPLIPSLGEENISIGIEPTKARLSLNPFSQEIESLFSSEEAIKKTNTESGSSLFPLNRFPHNRDLSPIEGVIRSRSLTTQQLTGADANNLISVEPEPLEATVNQIKGTAGREQIEGTEGKDIIIGGFGADTISGGAGEDIFVYESLRDAGDIILDFELNKDKIDLSTVLSSIGYQGDSPLADGYVTLTAYDGGTVVNLGMRTK